MKRFLFCYFGRSSNSFRYYLSFGWKRLRSTCLSDYTLAAIAWITHLVCLTRCRMSHSNAIVTTVTTRYTVNHKQPTQPGYCSNLSLINLRITYCYGVYLRAKRLLTGTLILLKVDNLKLNNALSTIEHAMQSQEHNYKFIQYSHIH
jgi:hypothetical protein